MGLIQHYVVLIITPEAFNIHWYYLISTSDTILYNN